MNFNLNLLLIGKMSFLVVDFVYFIFLLIVLNRVSSMNRLIKETHDAFILKSIAVFNLLLAASLFLLALAIL